MDKFYLVKSNPNWADEIDFEGFDLFDEDEYQEALKEFQKPDIPTELSFWGGNQEYFVRAKEVLSDLKNAEVIDVDKYDFLVEHFGDHYGDTYYGWWLNADEQADEDEDYDDEEDYDEDEE